MNILIYFTNREGKTEKAHQHYYYLLYKQMGPNRTLKSYYKYIRRLEKENKLELPPPARNTTLEKWYYTYEWPNRLILEFEKETEEMQTIDMETNTKLHKDKAKRILNFSKVLTKIQSVFTNMALDLDPNNPAMLNSFTSLGYLIRAIESFNTDENFKNNNLTEITHKLKEARKAMESHYNKYVTSDEYLENEIKAIDYYFKEYADE